MTDLTLTRRGEVRADPLTVCPRCGGTPRAKADGTPRKHWRRIPVDGTAGWNVKTADGSYYRNAVCVA